MLRSLALMRRSVLSPSVGLERNHIQESAEPREATGSLRSAFTETPAAPGLHGTRLGHVLSEKGRGTGKSPRGYQRGRQTKGANSGWEADSSCGSGEPQPLRAGCWNRHATSPWPRPPRLCRGHHCVFRQPMAPAASGSRYLLTRLHGTKIYVSLQLLCISLVLTLGPRGPRQSFLYVTPLHMFKGVYPNQCSRSFLEASYYVAPGPPHTRGARLGPQPSYVWYPQGT